MSDSNMPWQRVADCFHEALEKPAAQREAFVAKRCGEDRAWRHAVLNLLAAHDAASDFLDKPPADEAGKVLTYELNSALIGRRFGAWEVIDLIHVGGMGAVFRARRADGEFEKEAALKVIRLGLESAALRARFAEERAYLARMEHPYIARLIDGGTTEEGDAFLVMEYVDGRPIDQWAEEQALSLARRMRLFCRLCEGVEYAHQRLIVHQDIKPGNVLVAQDGTPRLLDFGIASRLSNSGGSESRPAAVTPTYSSPEQLRGETVTVASDVYSLGVVLYRLLTGVNPVETDDSTPQEIAEHISRTTPLPPSEQDPNGTSRAAGSTRELDAICLRALAGDPAQRYQSAADLREDVQRALSGFPVHALPASPGYRLQRFLRRQWIPVASATLVFASLVIGLAFTTYSLRQAQVARADAELRFQQVRELTNRVMFDVFDEIEDIPGSKSARQMLVTTVDEYLGTLKQSPNPLVMLEAARGYARLATLFDDQAVADGDRNRSEQAANAALLLYQELTQLPDTPADAYRGLGELLSNRGTAILYNDNDAPGARADIERALRLFDDARQGDGGDAELEGLALTARIRLADTYKWQNNYQEAETVLTQVMDLADQAADRYPGAFVLEKAQADARRFRGEVRYFDDRFGEAIDDYEEAARRYRKLADSNDGKNPVLQAQVINAWSLGNALVDAERSPEAVPHFRQALQLTGLRLQRDQDDRNAQRTYVILQSSLAGALVKLGDTQEAIELALAANHWFVTQAKSDDSLGVQRSVAVSFHETADIYAGAGQHGSACRWYRKTLDQWQRIDAGPGIPEFDAEQPAIVEGILAECQSPAAD